MKYVLHLLVVLCTALPGTAQLASFLPDAADTPNVTVELLSEAVSVAPGKPFTVGVVLTAKSPWHYYWKNPGTTGFPTTLDWTLPDGFTAGEARWPAPHTFIDFEAVGYGFEGSATVLVELTPPADLAPGKELPLSVLAKWLACDPANCVPGEATAKASLTSAAAPVPAPSPVLARFEAARKALPVSPEAAKLAVRAESTPGTLAIVAPASVDTDHLTFYPYDKALSVAATTAKWITTNEQHRLEIPWPAEFKPDDGAPLGILSRGDDLPAIELPAPAAPPPEPLAFGALLKWLGFAFIGGLILNLMPCVFPVLSLKVLGFVQQAQHGKGTALHHAFVFTAGVLASFWAIVAVLLALKASGIDAGWGFQLSNPLFVLGMTYLMFIIGLNLLGVFEVGNKLTAVGGGLTQKGGMSGSFFSGLLATLLATPCTAPFMAPALAVALAQTGLVTFLIFTAIALGMAAPYVVLSANQSLLNAMPRPGAWMESFKQFLAFMMFATVVWLVWTFASVAGTDRIARILTGLLLLGMAGWAYGRWGSNPGRSAKARRIGKGAAALLFLAAIMVGPSVPKPDWPAFSPEVLAESLENGDPVFIDFTATWCVTCQANKKGVLKTAEIKQAFADAGVKTLMADYTQQPAEMTAFIRSLGRAGVPVYALYDPSKGPDAKPVLLPNTLTKGIVKEALAQLPASDEKN